MQVRFRNVHVLDKTENLLINLMRYILRVINPPSYVHTIYWAYRRTTTPSRFDNTTISSSGMLILRLLLDSLGFTQARKPIEISINITFYPPFYHFLQRLCWQFIAVSGTRARNDGWSRLGERPFIFCTTQYCIYTVLSSWIITDDRVVE